MSSRSPKPSKSKPKSGAAAARSRRPPQPYFLAPAAKGAQAVYRRPVGNRSEPTLCGVMPTKALATALVAQLRRAESVLSDLFLEATDDGIEALEAILTQCGTAVLAAAARRPAGRAPAAPRKPTPEGDADANSRADGADGADAGAVTGDDGAPPPPRRRSRRGRRSS